MKKTIKQIEEVDEPSRVDLEEAVMISADSFGFDELEEFIDISTDTTEELRRTLECLSDEDLIDMHNRIEKYKKNKETKAKRRRQHCISVITDAIFFVPGGDITREKAIEVATLVAKKLKL